MTRVWAPSNRSLTSTGGLPIDLSDEATVVLVEFLHEVTDALERHYGAQLRRHYQPNDIAQCDLDLVPTPTDPPF